MLQVAQKYSLDGSGKRGGYLGVFWHRVMASEFEKAVFYLEKGHVS